MEDVHPAFTAFKDDFPLVFRGHEDLGKTIHEHGGPLPEKTRWLIKVVASGASRHTLALETHIAKAKEAGVTDEEIKHALLLIIQTAGFPTFMEAYTTYRSMAR